MTAKKWLLIAAVAVVAVVIWMLAQQYVLPTFVPDDEPVAGYAIATEFKNRPECPDSVDSAFVLPGPITNIPEFHDCQRFQFKKTKNAVPWSYGSLYAIWVRYRIDTIVFPRVITAPNKGESTGIKTGGNPAANLSTTTVVPPSTAYGVPVALIYSYGSKYHPLKIEPGFNCLYLYHPRSGTPEWGAKMVSVTDQSECDKNINPESTTNGNLEAHGTSVSTFTQSDYPPVARWDRDPVTGHQYAGVRCESAWCEIGETGFHPSASYPPLSTSPAQGERVFAIKGWYDEQYLAVQNTAGLTPGSVMGTAYPDSALGHRKQADFLKTWRAAAHIVLHSASDAYQSKLNLEPGAVPEPADSLNLCYGTKRDCVPQGSESSVQCQDNGQQTYWAKIVSTVTKTTRYKCVTYRAHFGVNMPATVRWRWLYNDETNWVRCPDGCCQVHP